MAFYYGVSGQASSWAAPGSRPWSKAEDKVFEGALVAFPEHVPNRWALVASRLPGRTPQEAWDHYQALVSDVDLIERGVVDAPGCWDDDDDDAVAGGARAGGAGRGRGEERRRGVPWTEEEHRTRTRIRRPARAFSLTADADAGGAKLRRPLVPLTRRGSQRYSFSLSGMCGPELGHGRAAGGRSDRSASPKEASKSR